MYKRRIKKLEKRLCPELTPQLEKALDFVEKYVGCDGLTQKQIREYYKHGLLTGEWDNE